MKKIKDEIESIFQTCFACPSQWEILLKNGKYVYVRYRWGNLGYGIGENIEDAIRNYRYGVNIGNEMDGVLSQEKMLEELDNLLFI